MHLKFTSLYFDHQIYIRGSYFRHLQIFIFSKKLQFLEMSVFSCREETAIKELLTVTKDTRIGGSAEGAHLHIVHLSDSQSSLELIKVGFI